MLDEAASIVWRNRYPFGLLAFSSLLIAIYLRFSDIVFIYGADTWFHLGYINSIADGNLIPPDPYYGGPSPNYLLFSITHITLGGLAYLTGLPGKEVWRLAPIILVPIRSLALYKFLQLLTNKKTAFIGVILFSLAVPEFWIFLLLQGHLARGIFLPLALYFTVRLLHKFTRRDLILAGVFASLTLQIHSVVFAFLYFLPITVYLAVRGLRNHSTCYLSLRSFGASLLIALLIASPWLFNALTFLFTRGKEFYTFINGGGLYLDAFNQFSGMLIPKDPPWIHIAKVMNTGSGITGNEVINFILSNSLTILLLLGLLSIPTFLKGSREFNLFTITLLILPLLMLFTPLCQPLLYLAGHRECSGGAPKQLLLISSVILGSFTLERVATRLLRNLHQSFSKVSASAKFRKLFFILMTTAIVAPHLAIAADASILPSTNEPFPGRRVETAEEFLGETVARYIQGNTSLSDVIAADPITSYLLPGLAGRKVLFSEISGFTTQDRLDAQRKIFDPKVSIKETREILDRYNVSLIILHKRFWENPSKLQGGELADHYFGDIKIDPAKFESLTKVIETKEVAVYKV